MRQDPNMIPLEVDDDEHRNLDLPPDSGLPQNKIFIKYKKGAPMVYKVDLGDVNHYKLPKARAGDQQSDINRQVALQYAYLTGLAEHIDGMLSWEDKFIDANTFANRLSDVAQGELTDYVRSKNIEFTRSKPAKLRVVGGFANRFALPDSDLDMTLLPHKELPRDLETAYPRVLEKKFLDMGLGARFLPNERIPVLQVCEKPSLELLKSLRAERAKWESGRHITVRPGESLGVKIPNSEVGLRCNITFSQKLSRDITSLLKCYSLCDFRVRYMVLFVKRWAKNRGINDPSTGTLSSLGYILMVLHYLMNVCNPPVIPNLHHDGPRRTKTVQGRNIGFHNDEEEIASLAKTGKMSRNRECLASLLQGFFVYYASRGPHSPEGGFNWVSDTISISTRGGLLPKIKTGWTRARIENGFKNNYLLAIQDPFDLSLNHGQTVNYFGLQHIKDEFSRANTIIRRIQYIPGAGLMWRNDKGHVGENLLAAGGERSYQENVPSTKSRKVRMTNDTTEGNVHTVDAKPSNEPVPESHQQPARPPVRRGLRDMLDLMARYNPPDTTLKRREQQREKNLQQISRGALEMRRIMGLEGEVSKWEAPVNPSSTGANSHSQKPSVTQTSSGNGFGKKVGDPDLPPSLVHESADGDCPDWDSLKSWCSSETDSNAELIAELPFDGINISFKKK